MSKNNSVQQKNPQHQVSYPETGPKALEELTPSLTVSLPLGSLALVPVNLHVAELLSACVF